MSVRTYFSPEICLPGLPGTITTLTCMAESEDNSSELGAVFIISTLTSRWDAQRGGYTHNEFKRPVSEFHWEWKDPIIASMAPQIWAVARTEKIAKELRDLWKMDQPSKPTKLGVWEDA